MASAEDDLQCGLCLNTYKNPKFLPCHHTFCEACVADLVRNASNRPLKCPKCRQGFQLPPGGVCELQSNFYLTPLLSPERCTLHRTETLRFFCTDCQAAICRDCRLTEHFQHDAQDLGKAVDDAKKELQCCEDRLGRSEATLRKQLEVVRENVYFCGESGQAVKRLVRKRVEAVTAMVRECGEEVEREVEAAFGDLKTPLQQDQARLEDRLSTVRALQQEVTQGLGSASSQSLLSLSADMRSGRGSQEQCDQLTSDLAVHTERSVLRCDDTCLSRDVIRQYLGHVELFQPIPLERSVTIKEVFRCCEDTQLYVHAVFADGCYKTVYVAYGASGAGGQGWVAYYWQNRNIIDRPPGTIRGRVCLGGLNEGFVRVEGREFPAKDWCLDDFLNACKQTIEGQYDVYNKGAARFLLRVHQSGRCDLRSVTVTDWTRTSDVMVCEVSAKTPVAMDVSKDGQLMAVLEEGQDHVMLYRHGNTQPHAVYRGSGEAFRPLDVCFYVIGGEERLVVADWLNDVLHVVEVGESCTVIGHVGWDEAELVKPTALFADREGRLWVGCQGGHVLTLSQQ